MTCGVGFYRGWHRGFYGCCCGPFFGFPREEKKVLEEYKEYLERELEYVKKKLE